MTTRMCITDHNLAVDVIEKFLEKQCVMYGMRLLQTVRELNAITWRFLATEPRIPSIVQVRLNDRSFIAIQFSETPRLQEGDTLYLAVRLWWRYDGGDSPASNGGPRNIELQLACAI